MNFHQQEKTNKRIIGILGGTFDPIHLGHLQLAVAAHKQFNIPEILVMPSGNPSSYKDIRHMTSAQDRCNMVQAAIAGYSYMKLSKLEIERPGNTYTSDTLAALAPQYDVIYFIIGADSLFALPTWHEAAYVMSHCRLLAANRNQHKQHEIQAQIAQLENVYQAQISLLNLPDLPYSSTEIRMRAAKGLSIETMVPEAVQTYIQEHRLYISTTDGDYK